MRSVPFRTLIVAPAIAAGMAGTAQPVVIDGVVAVVSNEPVLYSDLAVRIDEAERAGEPGGKATACAILENLLFEKLLLEQARIDSVNVDAAQVDAELQRRINYFVQQIGSEQKLEEFYGKSISTIKAEFRERVEDQLLIETMQQQVVGDIRITPRDVEKLYNSIPKDSLPRINAEVEYSMILKTARPPDAEVSRVKRRMEEFRQDIVSGKKDFCVLAILYSEDPGSKENCGELGLVSPGMMVQAFDAVALSLREGEVSQVFETEYGFHIMRMIQRRGEQYNAQHILLRPQTTSADQAAVRSDLERLATSIRLDSITFTRAALTLSDDEETRNSGGTVVNPATGSPRWSMDDLDQQDFFVIDKLKVGEISEPLPFTQADGTKAWRLIRLDRRTDPHVANLKDDQPLFQRYAEAQARQKKISAWILRKLEETYVRIDPDYQDCEMEHPWTGAATGIRP